jgi:hypothetical protein
LDLAEWFLQQPQLNILNVRSVLQRYIDIWIHTADNLPNEVHAIRDAAKKIGYAMKVINIIVSYAAKEVFEEPFKMGGDRGYRLDYLAFRMLSMTPLDVIYQRMPAWVNTPILGVDVSEMYGLQFSALPLVLTVLRLERGDNIDVHVRRSSKNCNG